jgi:hypothetical protein
MDNQGKQSNFRTKIRTDFLKPAPGSQSQIDFRLTATGYPGRRNTKFTEAGPMRS